MHAEDVHRAKDRQHDGRGFRRRIIIDMIGTAKPPTPPPKPPLETPVRTIAKIASG